MACSTLLPTTTTSVFLVKSDKKFPWPPPMLSLNCPAPRRLPEHILWNFPCSRAHRYSSQYLSHRMIVAWYSFLTPPHTTPTHQTLTDVKSSLLDSLCQRQYPGHIRLQYICLMNELGRDREKVEKSTSQRPRGKAQVQNESPQTVKSNTDLQIVTLFQQCRYIEKPKRNLEKGRATEKTSRVGWPLPSEEVKLGSCLPKSTCLFT